MTAFYNQKVNIRTLFRKQAPTQHPARVDLFRNSVL